MGMLEGRLQPGLTLSWGCEGVGGREGVVGTRVHGGGG